MKGLYGDFATMPLKDLVVYLGNRKATGTLNLEQGPIRKQVVIVGGDVMNSSSNEPREYLGQFLINLGQISEEQFHRAYETQRETRIFLGRILVMIGAVTEAQVAHALNLKTRETLLEAFQWTSGTFAFEGDKVPELPQGVELRVPLLEIQRESQLREKLWAQMRQVFTSGKLHLSIDKASLAEEPKPGSLDDRLLHQIETGKTIDEIILALHATDFFLYQRLYALHSLGAVAVDEGISIELSIDDNTEGLDVNDEPSEDEMLANARTFVAQGNLRDALALARRAHQLKPTPESQALSRQVEEKWVVALRKELLAGTKVPKVRIDGPAIRAMALSAQERYLLSRMDGKRTLAAIVSVSPLRELDALAHVQKFLEKGLIKLELSPS
ncbi:MAG: DUF4388 domain-containing protein [Archangiaceae bacterium]|nr:DUF4388 domain-containing protein [Archangiaceae bacterium]